MDKANIHVADAVEQSLALALKVGGKIAFDDLRVTHVFSPVTGRVTRVLAKPGEKLKKGAPLVTILSPDVGSQFSDVLKAHADLQTSEADFHREAQLLAEDATSSARTKPPRTRFARPAPRTSAPSNARRCCARARSTWSPQEYWLRTFIDGEVIARNVNPGIEVVDHLRRHPRTSCSDRRHR